MPTSSPANLRAFVRRHTRLVPVPDVPGVRLCLGDDVATLSRLTDSETGRLDGGIPYWAFAWAGGLAIARHLVDQPGLVAGRRVVDLGSGSGLCGIVAMRCGARSVRAYDVDPCAEAAVSVNSRANRVSIGFSRSDIVAGPPPDCDVILAGDVCYEEAMSDEILDWLRSADRAGIRVLIGDPGRRYLPVDLTRLATYRVRTSLELERAEVTESSVFTFSPTGVSTRAVAALRGYGC